VAKTSACSALVCRHINYKLYIVDNFSYIALQNSIYMFRY